MFCIVMKTYREVKIKKEAQQDIAIYGIFLCKVIRFNEVSKDALFLLFSPTNDKDLST